MKKILIITYYWPPSGGPGVQRWLKFVKYLRDFNIEPVVYIPKNPHYPLSDDSLKTEIPQGITIYSHAIFEPYKLAGIFSKKKTSRISSGIISTKNQSFVEKIMLWIRGNFFIPDARKYWIKPSVRYLENVITKEKITQIITTGPPHSVHLIGYGLKQKLSVKWLADFRDPWTSIGYHHKLKLSRASQRKHKSLEHLVLNSADRIVVTSNQTKKEFQQITSKTIKVITNGFDTVLAQKSELDNKFTISHIGSLLTGRNPKNLWAVLKQLIEEHNDFRTFFQLQLIGIVSKDVLETIKEFGLEPYLKLEGYLSHTAALNAQKKSQILLLVEIDAVDTQGIIAGKLFEYMAAQRPILGFGPKNWEVADIVKETNTGVVFDYQDQTSLKNLLLFWFEEYLQNRLHVTANGIEKYSRRELTRELAEYIPWE